jgi:hypothetical protein
VSQNTAVFVGRLPCSCNEMQRTVSDIRPTYEFSEVNLLRILLLIFLVFRVQLSLKSQKRPWDGHCGVLTGHNLISAFALHH